MAKITLVIYYLLLEIGVCSINIRGINNVGITLFQKIESDNANAIFSPYSVGFALHSLLMGTGTSSQEQLSQFLQSSDEAHLEMEKSHKDLSKVTENVRLTISNLMFHHHETELAEQFLRLSRAHFNTSSLAVNFSDEELKQSLQTINDQIASETNGKITEVLTQDIVTEDTRLVLVNILYFKGRWQHAFKKYNTRDREFYLEDERHVMVPTMQQTQMLRYLETSSYQSAVLPFKDTSVEMVLYRPKQKLRELIHTLLNHDQIDLDYKRMSYSNVELLLPQFTADNKYSLKEALVALGLTHLFDDRVADFSRMTASGLRELVLSEVLHNTYISVDEEGCEAAAVTTSIMRLTRSAPGGEEPVKLHFNVPFLYMLRDRDSGSLLFVGAQTHFQGRVVGGSKQLERTEL